MNDTGGELVNIVADLSADLTKESVKATGVVAKEILLALINHAKEKQPIGETNLQKLLQSGQEIKVTRIKSEFTKEFTKKAKKLGIAYAVVKGGKEEKKILFKASDEELMKMVYEDIIDIQCNREINNEDKKIEESEVKEISIDNIELEKATEINELLNKANIKSTMEIKDLSKTNETSKNADVSFFISKENEEGANKIIEEYVSKKIDDKNNEHIFESLFEGRNKERDLCITMLNMDFKLKAREISSLSLDSIKDNKLIVDEKTITLNEKNLKVLKNYLEIRNKSDIKEDKHIFLSSRKTAISERTINDIIRKYKSKEKNSEQDKKESVKDKLKEIQQSKNKNKDKSRDKKRSKVKERNSR